LSETTGNGTTYRTVYQKAIEFSFQALGSQVSSVVVNYLSRKYGMALGDTFSKPDSLGEALEGTLGAGAILIERRIVKSIYAQLSSPLNGPDIRLRNRQDFDRYVMESQILFRKIHP
jgi:hypothetical protein